MKKENKDYFAVSAKKAPFPPTVWKSLENLIIKSISANYFCSHVAVIFFSTGSSLNMNVWHRGNKSVADICQTLVPKVRRSNPAMAVIKDYLPVKLVLQVQNIIFAIVINE